MASVTLYSDGTPTVTYTYDATGIAYSKGKLSSVSSSVSATHYNSFDAMGRVTAHQQVTDGQSYQMGYGYNLVGAITTQTYPSGRIVSTSYDQASRITSVNGQKSGEAAKNYASQFTYAPHGAVTDLTLGKAVLQESLISYNQPFSTILQLFS